MSMIANPTSEAIASVSHQIIKQLNEQRRVAEVHLRRAELGVSRWTAEEISKDPAMADVAAYYAKKEFQVGFVAALNQAVAYVRSRLDELVVEAKTINSTGVYGSDDIAYLEGAIQITREIGGALDAIRQEAKTL